MSKSKHQLLPSGTLLDGKYQLGTTLGTGGMGAVYAGTHRAIGKRVAIKVLSREMTENSEMVARFRREARAAALIGHPGIADVFDFGTTEDGLVYLVMEYLEGTTLTDRLKRDRTLPLDEAVSIAEQVLDVLDAAHRAGVVHRDLKPGNLFLLERPRGVIKVLDFGIAKVVDSDGESLSLTQTGISLGTPHYMSPEQLRNTRDAGPASDLYSLGVVLYRMLAGVPPFDGQSFGEIFAKAISEPHAPLRSIAHGVPEALSLLVDALLSKKPERRPASASEARTALLASVRPVMSEAVVQSTEAPSPSTGDVAEQPTGFLFGAKTTPETVSPFARASADAPTYAPVLPPTASEPSTVNERALTAPVPPGAAIPAVSSVPSPPALADASREAPPGAPLAGAGAALPASSAPGPVVAAAGEAPRTTASDLRAVSETAPLATPPPPRRPWPLLGGLAAAVLGGAALLVQSQQGGAPAVTPAAPPALVHPGALQPRTTAAVTPHAAPLPAPPPADAGAAVTDPAAAPTSPSAPPAGPSEALAAPATPSPTGPTVDSPSPPAGPTPPVAAGSKGLPTRAPAEPKAAPAVRSTPPTAPTKGAPTTHARPTPTAPDEGLNLDSQNPFR